MEKISIDIRTETNYLSPNRVQTINTIVNINCDDLQPRKLITGTTLILLIDTSGSMSGDKLTIVRASIDELLRNVDSKCAISIITFDAEVRELTSTPLQTTEENQLILRDHLQNMIACGSTNITGAIASGLRQAAEYRFNTKNTVEILLFTDGQHNVGDTWDYALYNIANKLSDFPIPIHTFSIGVEPDAAKLMLVSKCSAGGHYEHMGNTDDVPRVIGAHIGALKTRLCSDCVLHIEAYPGTRIQRVSGMDCSTVVFELAKKYEFRIGSLIAGGKKTFLCVLSIRAMSNDEFSKHGKLYHALGAMLSSHGKLIQSTLTLNRVDPMTHRVKYGVICEIVEATLREKLRIVLTKIAKYADAAQLISARMIVEENIIAFAQYSNAKSQNIAKFVTEALYSLDNIQKNLTTQIAYMQSRNHMYGLISSHDMQYSGDYQTENQKLISGETMANVKESFHTQPNTLEHSHDDLA